MSFSIATGHVNFECLRLKNRKQMPVKGLPEDLQILYDLCRKLLHSNFRLFWKFGNQNVG